MVQSMTASDPIGRDGMRHEEHGTEDNPRGPWLKTAPARIDGAQVRTKRDQTRLAIAFANDIVLPSPPRSGVSESFASSVAMIAARRRSAFSGWPR